MTLDVPALLAALTIEQGAAQETDRIAVRRFGA